MLRPRQIRAAIIRRVADRVVRVVWNARYQDIRRKYDLAESFHFNGPGTDLYGPGTITGGYDSYIGRGSLVQAVEGTTVSIGSGCAISHGVRIYTSNRHPDDEMPESRRISGDVTIGDHVWIGVNAFVGQGVSIGDNAVIGANSVVTKDVAAWTIVSGVPAGIVRRKRNAPPDITRPSGRTTDVD